MNVIETRVSAKSVHKILDFLVLSTFTARSLLFLIPFNPMPNQSLTAFCKAHNLPKSTVHAFLKREQIDTSAGLTPKAVEAINAYFLESIPTAPTAPSDGAMTIHEGNHCQTLTVPSFGGLEIDLGQFRDSESLILEDPLAAAEQFLAAADMLQGALGADIAQREQRLAATKAAQAQVSAKAQQLALEQRLYKLQTAQLDSTQTDTTKALADSMAALQALGKSAADGGQSQPG